MHITQFVHRYPPALGGSEAYTARLCDYLAACGDDVRVCTSSAIELEEMWCKRGSNNAGHDGALMSTTGERSPRVTRFKPLTFPTRRCTLKALSLVPWCWWQCLTSPCNPVCPGMWHEAGRSLEPVDAVHAAAFPYSFPILCGLRLARRHGVPFFLTPFLHLGDPANPQNLTRRQYTRPHLTWLLRQADGVFVQTRLERDAVIGLGVRAERVFLHGLGVEETECTNGDRKRIRSEWAVRPEEVVIGHLANNSVEKGTCDLLRAATRLWQQGQRFRVVLAGPQMPNFLSFWGRFPQQAQVIRMGVLSEEQKRDFFAGVDAFALPSFTDSFGLVLLEAWANGKPNLVYRAGGPGELVRDGIDGLQARCGEVEELAVKMKLLMSDERLRRTLGENGRGRISREFQWGDKLKLVRDVLAGRAPVKASPRSLQRHQDHLTIRARAG